jgi:hypothetical protein
MLSRLTPQCRDDQGMSLILVIGFGFIAMALMIVGTTIATRSLASSREHSHFEGALSAAENGIDAALARSQRIYDVTGTDSYVTPSTGIPGDSAPDCNAAAVSWSATMPNTPTNAQERAFARSTLLALPASCVHVTSQGDYAFFKPAGRQTVYAMGWFPHKAATGAKTRLLKAEYLFVPYRPMQAILSSGPVTLGSSTTVTSAPPNDPALAGVHSNSTVSVENGNPIVYGPVSSTASSSASSNKFYSNTATGGAVTQTPAIRIPAVNAREVWTLNHATNPPGGWYDLCADGTARDPDGVDISSGQPVPAPCKGTIRATGSFRGWTFDGSGSVKVWTAGSGLKTSGYSGTYYVNGADIKNDASNAGSSVPNLTVIASAATSTCSKVAGNISWDKTDVAAPSLPNLFMVADQDIKIDSNYFAGSASGGTVVSGQFIAGDQIEMQTSSNGAYGSVVAADQCDPADGNSLVDKNLVKNPSIYYDPNAMAPFIDIINTTLWLEYTGS